MNFSIGEIVRTSEGPSAFMLIESVTGDSFYGNHLCGGAVGALKVNCTYPTARELETIREQVKGFTESSRKWLAACDATVEVLHKKMLAQFDTERSIGKKFDSEKTQYHLMPLHALEQVNLVLMHGAKKYGENNWQKVEGWQHRYYNAVLRHMFAWQSGEKNDSETNISHLAHAICSLMFLIEIEFQNEVIGLLLNEIETDEQNEK